jgi:DNA-binding transcriptional regulator YdaS (Cro superfamily)
MNEKKNLSTSLALNLPAYNPGNLLDWIKQQMKVKDDAALARQLKISRPVVDGLRQGRLPLSATLCLAIAQAAGITLEQLREIAGDRRAKFRLASVRCA